MSQLLRSAALAGVLLAAAGSALAGDKPEDAPPVFEMAPPRGEADMDKPDPPPPEVTPPPVIAAPDPAPEAKPPERDRAVSVAQGAALLQMFQTFCRQTHAGAGAVIAAAERDGYSPASTGELKAFAGIELRDLQVRTKTVDGITRMVGSAHGSSERVEGRPGMDVCIVSVSPGGADATGAFGRWVGVDPMASVDGARSVYMFLEGPRGRQSIGEAGSPGELRRRMRDGDLQLLMVGDEGDATLAIYGVMRPEI